MPSPAPSIAELRTVCQPATVVGRRSAEHWAGRLYMRRVSVHVTRRVLPLPVSANGWTVVMIVVGVAAAAVLTVPGLLAAVVAALGIQVYLLLDCVDGEVARWRETTSAAGVYLDRLGHYVVEAALLIALGVRVDGGLGAVAGATSLGLLAAVLALLSKAESDLVTVARASSGLTVGGELEAASQVSTLRGLRRIFAVVPVHRILGAVELSLLALLAAVIDALVGGAAGSRVLLLATVAVGALVAIGHPVMILTSRRLR